MDKTKKPTDDGLYWLWVKGEGDEARMVQVQNASSSWPIVLFIGSEIDEHLVDIEGEWLGPIAPPVSDIEKDAESIVTMNIDVVEAALHKSIAGTFKELYDKCGLIVTSVKFVWMDVSTQDKEDRVISNVTIESDSSNRKEL